LNNPWKIVLLKIYWFSFHFIFWSLVIACLFVSLFVNCHIGNWKGRLVSSLEEFESRSKGPTTLRAIGLRRTPNWVNHQREPNHRNWGLLCNFVIRNLLTFIAFKFCNKKEFHWKCRNVPFYGRATRDSRDTCSMKGIRAESPPTFIWGKRWKNRRKTGQKENSKFGSCIYAWGRY